jgi:hypothetical protein
MHSQADDMIDTLLLALIAAIVAADILVLAALATLVVIYARYLPKASNACRSAGAMPSLYSAAGDLEKSLYWHFNDISRQLRGIIASALEYDDRFSAFKGSTLTMVVIVLTIFGLVTLLGLNTALVWLITSIFI